MMPVTIVFDRQSERDNTALYSPIFKKCGVAHVS